MKSGLLLIGVALLLGGLVGTLVVRDPGYVLIAYADGAIETSLWFAVVVLVLFYLLLRLGIAIFSSTAHSGSAFGAWRRRRKSSRSRNQTLQGMLRLAQGDWPAARKLLTQSAGVVETPLINYLAAARAAQETGDIAGRDALLNDAQASTPGSAFAVALTRAELQQAAGQWQQSLATLLQLRKEAPRHSLVLRMLIAVYQQLSDHQALLEILPDAKKAKAFGDREYRELLIDAWEKRITAAGSSVQEVYAQLPKELNAEPRLIVCYAQALKTQGADEAGLEPIRKALKRQWSPELVRCFGELRGDDPASQLRTAETWFKDHPNDPELLLTLGRLALSNEHWSQAREYLEASLRWREDDDVYAELGRLCLASGDSKRGGEYLLRSRAALPELPMPDEQSQADRENSAADQSA